MGHVDNPFERYDLDPRDGITAITQRLRELAEDAKDEKERERIRAAWEELTLHPARRLRAALFAHPETRPPLGNPPMLMRMRRADSPLDLRDLAARPSVLRYFADTHDETKEDEPPSFADDPVL